MGVVVVVRLALMLLLGAGFSMVLLVVKEVYQLSDENLIDFNSLMLAWPAMIWAKDQVD